MATVRTQQPNDTAWQRFLHTGPLALLPVRDGYSNIVWSTSLQQASALEKASPQEFALAVNEVQHPSQRHVALEGTRCACLASTRGDGCKWTGLSTHDVAGVARRISSCTQPTAASEEHRGVCSTTSGVCGGGDQAAVISLGLCWGRKVTAPTHAIPRHAERGSM